MANEVVLDQQKEGEPRSRKVVLHFIRHGETQYKGDDDHDGHLTEIGQQQAKQAAIKLFGELPQDCVLTFYSSPRQRAQQTSEVIKQELVELNQNSSKQIFFRNSSPKTYTSVGLNDRLTEEFLDLQDVGQDPITSWLKEPNEFAVEIETGFRRVTQKLASFARRLHKNGPNLHIVIVTHTGPSEVFVGRLIGGIPSGSLANCEEFSIELPVSQKEAILHYKDINQKINV